MTFQVKLQGFEGPLDLLLHLIREHQVDILDIPIARITDEYLRTLALMQELDLDVAGEFLVMAATLIHIKSRMLLPPEEVPEGQEAEEADPRAELVDRLLEYQRFKEAAQTLGVLEGEQLLLHPRGAPATALEVEGPLEIPLLDLLRAFRDVLRRAPAASPVEIQPEELNVGQRLVLLVDRLAQESPLPFDRLFEGSARRVEIIVTFLALLEALRRGMASARQSDPHGPIMVYATLEQDEAAAGAAGEAAPDPSAATEGDVSVQPERSPSGGEGEVEGGRA
jgi:segregation and condensation protein A